MIQIALLGFGVVGAGTAALLQKHEKLIAARLGQTVHIKYILDLLDFPDSPFADRIVHDFNIILNDPEITLVAEMMGGEHPAYDFSKALLERGKSVVTSNKAVVAAFGCELLQIARAHRVSYAFEASVGGGIPIIRPMTTDFLSGQIQAICGILNGTTNYILTQMRDNGKTYAEALAEAQSKGYAEKDPTADVGGFDTCRKLCILTALATGVLPAYTEVHTEGITAIAAEDVRLLSDAGYAVKLLGVMKLQNGKPCCITAPFVCAQASPLCHVDDVFNGILIHADPLGDTMFYGRGAGADPTASAVANDILSLIRDGADSFAPVFKAAGAGDLLPSTAFAARRYIRTALPKEQLAALLGSVREIGTGAYLTDAAFADGDFAALAEKRGQISSLRIL
ncbi:MAG: homoserine dehydrogenase [Clostridia bacterium]|nr:homoserine dehydrogenase [Clostridia bacterium]